MKIPSKIGISLITLLFISAGYADNPPPQKPRIAVESPTMGEQRVAPALKKGATINGTVISVNRDIGLVKIRTQEGLYSVQFSLPNGAPVQAGGSTPILGAEQDDAAEYVKNLKPGDVAVLKVTGIAQNPGPEPVFTVTTLRTLKK